MKKFTKLMLTLAMLVVGVGGANSVKAGTIITKTPVLLTGGKFAECFVPGTYVIQMQGWQNFIAYEDAEGVAFDENSFMQFDMAEACNNGGVRVTFTFSDESTQEEWWCLGIGESANDTSTPYGHAFDNSKYWLKKGLGDKFEAKKSLKIKKVTVNNFRPTENGQEIVVTYKVKGGTICDHPMTIKNNWTTAFGAYSGVFTATAAQSNIFKMENFEVGDYQKVVIKFGEAVPSTGGWNLNNNSGLTNLTGKTEVEFALDGTAITDFTIFNWDANPDPINISEVYLYKEEDSAVPLSFNEVGFATTDKKYLTAEGGLSYNSSTGALSSDGTAGTLTLEFSEPVNLEDLNTFDVKRTGNSNIVNRLKFYDSDNQLINTWNNAKWTNNGLDYSATNAFKTNNAVKKLVWEADDNADNNGSTLTISGIEWQLKTISAMKGTDIASLPYKLWDADGDNDANVVGDEYCAKNFGVFTDMIYGNQNIGDSKKYVDLTNYKKMIVRGYGTIRLFYNWHQSTGEGDAESKPIDAKTFVNLSNIVTSMELDIPAFMSNNNMSHFHLIGVKGSGNCFVESISLLDGTEKYDYTISGTGGIKLQTAIDALADATATAIDATGLTNDPLLKIALSPANPNCLIFVNHDQLSNESNVIVDGTCANLVLEDKKPFKAPVDFTATAAKFTKTMNADYGTMVIPFDASVPTGVEAYEITANNGEVLTTNKVEEITANKPVMLKGSGTVFTASNAAIAATAEGVQTNGLLNGAYAATAVPTENSYVLQNQGGDVNFYKAVAGLTIDPFRAYLTTATAGARLSFDFDQTTGIKTIETAKDVNVYNLQGVRVANPTKGLYIVNGKKAIVK